MNTIKNRINGILYGVAVGDALGAPLEFMTAKEIQRKHGTVRDMIGGGCLNVIPGEVTDDTQMTLAVAEGIVEAPEKPIQAIGQRFIAWYNGRPKDVGSTCATSILYAVHITNNVPTEEEWLTAAQMTHNTMGGRSAGNGSLMRTAYPAMYYPDIEAATGMASRISRMTHFDPKASAACEVYTKMLHDLLVCEPGTGNGVIFHDAIQHRYDHVGDFYFTPCPTGYVADSFEAALHCILTTETLEDALVKAVNLGGDADTIGAITGGLAGALYGYDAIPARWLDCLDDAVKTRIDALNTKAVEQWHV